MIRSTVIAGALWLGACASPSTPPVNRLASDQECAIAGAVLLGPVPGVTLQTLRLSDEADGQRLIYARCSWVPAKVKRRRHKAPPAGLAWIGPIEYSNDASAAQVTVKTLPPPGLGGGQALDCRVSRGPDDAWRLDRCTPLSAAP